MKNPYVKKSLITALFLILCFLAQLLENSSVYLSETLVCGLLVIAALSCGYLWGGILALLAPLTAWAATGSSVISQMPQILLCQILANLLLVSIVWIFVKWLAEKMPKTESVALSDPKFRLVLIIAITAAVLWSGLTTAFISALSDLLQMENVSRLLVVSLIAIGGSLGIFVALWALVCRFPKLWPMVTGAVLASGAKFLTLWLLVSRGILGNYSGSLDPSHFAHAQSNFAVPQLFTALLGCSLAFLIYFPLTKKKEKKK